MHHDNIAAPPSQSNSHDLGDLLGVKLSTLKSDRDDSESGRRHQDDRTPLQADTSQIRRFVTVLFKHCVADHGLPWGGRFALRAFRHRDDEPVLLEWSSLAGKPVTHAAEAATRVARMGEPAVFCPPVCLFNESGRAREQDVLACPVVVAELDAAPSDSRRKIEVVLGPATLVVASGGSWTGPEGVMEDKLHVYWRLSTPAVSDEEKSVLKAVRKAAAELVGADITAAPLSHPLRWPGSCDLHQLGDEISRRARCEG